MGEVCEQSLVGMYEDDIGFDVSAGFHHHPEGMITNYGTVQAVDYLFNVMSHSFMIGFVVGYKSPSCMQEFLFVIWEGIIKKCDEY